MTEQRYKAFISYSHSDERWARWLQRALERYRVPKRLVGQDAEYGPVVARLRPIFRDREDLSSASDLSGRIKQELAASEALIVVCSPAAADSRWVQEEIRFFRDQGRADRILALVVDGDPNSEADGTSCFPPALIESESGERRDPLAADARRYADGKHLALLKIVAGLLGVRLDELRRRDAQRRRQRRIVNSVVAVSLALVIAWLFHSAQSSRETVRMQRENTEEYLAFMLGNLDRLAPIPGLETESPHDSVEQHPGDQLGLQDLDNGMLLERGRKWRENGLELLQEAELNAAMREFENSRAALIELLQRDRRSPVALFELGQSEFYVGAVHAQRGEIDEAQSHWYRYGALIRRLLNVDPYNPTYVIELAYTLNNIGANEQSKLLPNYELSVERLNSAIQFTRIAIGLDPENPVFQRDLTTMMEWQADAYWGLCDLGEALEIRQQTVTRRRDLLQENPGDRHDTENLAQTLAGLVSVQRDIGLLDLAQTNLNETVEIYQTLSAEAPEDVRLAWEASFREIRLARLMLHAGQKTRAAELILRQAPRIEELATAASGVGRFISVEASLFDIDHAQVLFEIQENSAGEEKLRSAVARLAEIVDEHPAYWIALGALVEAYFAYWEHFGTSPGPELDRLLARWPITLDNVQGCSDADLAARLAITRGDEAEAVQYVDFALEKGYYAPEFIEFCQRYDLCREP